jgi:hypothetical protein
MPLEAEPGQPPAPVASVIFPAESHVPISLAVQRVYDKALGGKELPCMTRLQLEKKILDSTGLSEEKLRYLIQHGGAVLNNEKKALDGVEANVLWAANDIGNALKACQDALVELDTSIALFRDAIVNDQMKADIKEREYQEHMKQVREKERAQNAINAKRAATRAANAAAKKAKKQ